MPTTHDGNIPVTDIAGGFTRRGTVYTGTHPWEDLNNWVTAHGLDPHQILAATGVVRDADARCIRFTGLLLDEHGQKTRDPHTGDLILQPMVEQGEAPPLPFPASIIFGPATRPALQETDAP